MASKILVTIPSFSEKAREILTLLGEVTYAETTNETIAHYIGEVEVLLVGLGTVYSKEVLESAIHLKVIATATTGLDHIDLEYAKERGITILSLKGENEFLDTITGTAELAFGLAVSLARNIPSALSDVLKGGWNREAFKGVSLYGKTLGIVGMGRLGKIMAAGAAGFRMKVVFYDPHVLEETFPSYSKVSFEELLKESDVVSLHVHLSNETTHLINKETLSLMKKSAILINTARGEIVDEAAVLEALSEGSISGYGADVLSGELDFKERGNTHPLIEYAQTHNNVLITPHIGGMTSDSRETTDVFMAQKLKQYLQASREGV